MNQLNCQNILDTLKSVVDFKGKSISLHEPLFAGKEWLYVKDCLDSGWVSYLGKYVEEFEARLVEYTGVKRAVAVMNGTAALHICLKIAGVGPGDEVIVPALTFVATANAVTYCGAIPHFVDSEERTLGLDPRKLSIYLQEVTVMKGDDCVNRKTGRRIRAVLPVHTFGHPVDLDPLLDVCRQFKLILIEDAAESLGSYYNGRHTGNWGKVSALSFNGNKTITTGGGGAILTNDEELGNLIKHITTTAKVPHPWEYRHDQTGYNYRLPNLNAAVGCAQMEQLETFLGYKRMLAERYEEAFRNVEGIIFFKEPEFSRSNYWLNVLLLDSVYEGQRDALISLAAENGIMVRPSWILMHRLPMYKECPRMDLTVAESLERRLINIPSSPVLGKPYA
ncbi:MAG: LegC family aminotransferase [Syntrophaceae bacterium]